MSLPADCHLAYVVGDEAWYRDPQGRPSLTVMASAEGSGGGAAWEFQVVEYDLGGKTVQLEVFADAFAAFHQIPGFFTALVELDGRRGGRGDVTLADMRTVLDGLGAVDETKRANPNQRVAR